MSLVEISEAINKIKEEFLMDFPNCALLDKIF